METRVLPLQAYNAANRYIITNTSGMHDVIFIYFICLTTKGKMSTKGKHL